MLRPLSFLYLFAMLSHELLIIGRLVNENFDFMTKKIFSNKLKFFRKSA